MLEIHETFSTQGYEDIIKSAGEYKAHITEAFDAGKVTGFIAYCYRPGETVILGLDDGGDLMLCDGLVRSVLFKSCLKGIDTAVFAIDDAKKLERLRKLKFIQNDEKSLCNLDEFMNSCKKCGENGQSLEKSRRML